MIQYKESVTGSYKGLKLFVRVVQRNNSLEIFIVEEYIHTITNRPGEYVMHHHEDKKCLVKIPPTQAHYNTIIIITYVNLLCDVPRYEIRIERVCI